MSSWLVEEGLGGLVDKFTANNIDGTELLGLTKETLASELHIGEDDRHTLLSGCYATSSVPRYRHLIEMEECKPSRVGIARLVSF